MAFIPTPFTAALAGLFSGIAMPLALARFGGDASRGTMVLVVAFLLAVALPAHACVVGFGRSAASAPGTLDTALLKRIVAWLATAVATVLVSAALRTN